MNNFCVSFLLTQSLGAYWIYLGACCELNWRINMPMGIQLPSLILLYGLYKADKNVSLHILTHQPWMRYCSRAYIKLTRMSLPLHPERLTFNGILVCDLYKADKNIIASTH